MPFVAHGFPAGKITRRAFLRGECFTPCQPRHMYSQCLFGALRNAHQSSSRLVLIESVVIMPTAPAAQLGMLHTHKLHMHTWDSSSNLNVDMPVSQHDSKQRQHHIETRIQTRFAQLYEFTRSCDRRGLVERDTRERKLSRQSLP